MFKKYSLEIFSIIMSLVVIYTVFSWESISFSKQMATVFIVVFTLHEWEENRFPGGFFEIMVQRMGISREKFDAELAHMIVGILLYVFLLVPYMFDDSMILLMIPVTLGIFEIFMHTFGIFMLKMKKPYTPGLITAIPMASTSFYVIYVTLSNGDASMLDIFIGFILMAVGYLIARNVMMKIAVHS